MPAILQAHHLTKRFGSRVVVDDVSFQVDAGEVFGFLGPNGAGKTTTIRMLVGLIRPDNGTIAIAGTDLRRDPERALAHAGAIIETPDLYEFMSGRENLRQFARMLGDGAEARIPELAQLVALDHRLDDTVAKYSLGMRQRLGIAQALLGKPRLLILDEPANGLDPAGIREIRDLLRRLAREDGMAVFISSHLLGEVELLCDRAAILHRGRILAEASIGELIAGGQPRVVFAVGDATAALAVLVARFPSSEPSAIDDGHIAAILDATGVTAANVALVEAGIAVFSIEPANRTLEDIFMSLTQGETV